MVSGSIMIPYYGIWVADVVLSGVEDLTPGVTLVIGNLSMVGHVFRSSSFSGSRTARIVGGHGGWRKKISSQSYSSTKKIKKSMVLRDAASACGEQVKIANDSDLGDFWVREEGPAVFALRQIVGKTWFMGIDGVTQISDRTDTSLIQSPFDVNSWSGSKGAFNIATEDVASFVPARTFSGVNIPSTQKISMTSITFDNKGKLRIDLLTTGFSDAA